MKVWLARRGCYSNEYVSAIYLTEERAIKAMTEELPGTFSKDDYGTWSNDRDWENFVTIEPFEVEE